MISQKKKTTQLVKDTPETHPSDYHSLLGQVYRLFKRRRTVSPAAPFAGHIRALTEQNLICPPTKFAARADPITEEATKWKLTVVVAIRESSLRDKKRLLMVTKRYIATHGILIMYTAITLMAFAG
ncbi:hypothetical protein KPH14_005347 [Odynerus spinipes]|uniref:Uncharacterized protein n=1 Tax=Odynerus spinipes TaxID=1348599 RepID=A0AAD9RBN1_9HYME|nr:hypothetical protein KPH14_005347 [Odynerus spinipes]